MWTWIRNWLWPAQPAQLEPPQIGEAKKHCPPIWLFIVPETAERPTIAALDTLAVTAPSKPEPAAAVHPPVDHLFARRLASVHKLNTPTSRAKNRRRLTAEPARSRPVPAAPTIKRQPPANAPRFARPRASPNPAQPVPAMAPALSPVAILLDLKAA